MSWAPFNSVINNHDVGLVDKEKEEWFVENINSISDSERNWNDVLDKLNEVAEENEQLKADKQSLIDFIRKEFPKSHKHILEGFE